MAIVLEFNYGKKLGLPGYSSHNFTVSVSAEVQNPEDILPETQRVYSLLQQSVDSQIIQSGYVPGDRTIHTQTQGSKGGDPPSNAPKATNAPLDPSNWKCSPKQTALILGIIDENQLPAETADAIAVELHAKPMSGLTKLEASGVVSEFLARYRRNRNPYKHGQGVGQ